MRHTPFSGSDLEVHTFEHRQPRLIEALFKVEFEHHKVTNELYKREHLHEYKSFMEDHSRLSEEEVSTMISKRTTPISFQ